MKRISSPLFLAIFFGVGIAQAQDTLYTYKDGQIVSKRATIDIDSMTFSKPKPVGPTIDGYTYSTVTIGNQVWFAENLRTAQYNDGTLIPTASDFVVPTTPAMFWWANDQANFSVNKHGALYNWFAVNTGKLCPVGWHVPSNAEWTVLTNYLGGESVAGGKMKITGYDYWLSPNAAATNSSGFNATGSGFRTLGGSYSSLNVNGYYSSSTENDSSRSLIRYLGYNDGSATTQVSSKGCAISVRCLKD
jgi:uncharacterized protein (TIGR02145 family)